MQIEIRRASILELNQITAIHRELNRPARASYSSEEFLIAWKDDEPIGCAGTSMHGDGAYFYGLAVRREWQKQGVGSQLMQARLNALHDTKSRFAVALVMFWNSRFFRKFGFLPIRRELLPPSAAVYSDITNPSLRRSAVMIRFLPGRGIGS
jgi:N-acetylglutamate synthase-like GNAT family acetyltransferase